MLMLEGSSEIEIKFFIFTDGKKKKLRPVEFQRFAGPLIT